MPILLTPTLPPLSVENLISDKGKVNINTKLVYGNSKSSQSEIIGIIPIQLSNNSYINLPTDINNNQNQSEYLVSAIGVKYGIGTKSDIGININGSYQNQHNINHHTKTNDSHLFDFLIFANHFMPFLV